MKKGGGEDCNGLTSVHPKCVEPAFLDTTLMTVTQHGKLSAKSITNTLSPSPTAVVQTCTKQWPDFLPGFFIGSKS